jgi:hypothetical protein
MQSEVHAPGAQIRARSVIAGREFARPARYPVSGRLDAAAGRISPN